MKNIPVIAFFSALVVFGLPCIQSCKDSTSDLGYGIDPENQKSLLCKSLRLLGINKDGTMPVGIGSGSSIVTSHPQAVEVSAGVLLYIPYTVNNTGNVCQIYLQVEGADNYWETKLTVDPGSNQPYFQILIPKFVEDGDFDLVFSLGDCGGNVSQLYSTKTIVSPQADCNTSISGAVGITVRSFDMGNKAGTAGFAYDMINIPDRMDIRYNGVWVASTGNLFSEQVLLPDCTVMDGFVSGTGKLTFDYNPKKSRFVEVYISGCDPDTRWDVMPMCPD